MFSFCRIVDRLKSAQATVAATAFDAQLPLREIWFFVAIDAKA
jgi:hypothetical protein